MKKIFAVLLIIIMACCLGLTAFAADGDKIDLCDNFDAPSTGWWVTAQNFADQPFYVRFTSPKAFKGFDYAVYAHEAKVKYTLYAFNTDIDTSVAGTAVWTAKETIVGDNMSYSVDFGKTFAAGQYVLVFEYDGSYVEGQHFIMGSAAAKSGVDAEIVNKGWNLNENTKAMACIRLVESTAAPVNTEEQKTNTDVAPETGDTSVVMASLILAAAAFTVVFRKKVRV